MNRSFLRPAFQDSRFVIFVVSALAIISYFIATPPSAASMAAFTVNNTADSVDATPGDGTCADSLGRCTLRAAVMEANALAGPDTISLPAGTYNLTLGPNDDEESFDGARADIGDLDVLNGDLTIVGAGLSTTIIDGGGIDRIFDVNNFAGPGVAVNLSISGVTLQHGEGKVGTFGSFSSGGAIQFDGFDLSGGPSDKRLTLTDCRVTNNTAAGQGGGIIVFFGSLTITGSEISNNVSSNSSGGGVAYDAGSSEASLRSLQITNSNFSNNRALNGTFGSGGGLQSGGRATFTIENNSFNGNQAGAGGGGISSDAVLAANIKSISKNKIENNSAKEGGGIFNRSGTLTFSLNVVVGNSASSEPTSSGFRQGTSVSGSIATLTNNWWGCNEGPGSAPCDRASGPLGFGPGPWLVLSHAATPNTIPVNSSTSLQADFFTPSSGPPVAAADLTALEGRAITFGNAVLGTISGAGTVISGGKANATFNAGATGGNGSADATVDHAAATATITIEQPTNQMTAVGPANVWIGLKSSDDVGTKFDLLAEALRNGVVVGSGQLNDVPGGSSGFNNAVQRTINMALTSGPVTFQSGDTLGFRLSVRIAASSGHVSGTARLWYNDAAANSRFDATIGGVTNSYYLRDGFVLATTPGPGPKKTSDVTVNRNVGGNPFKPFGTWSITF